MSSQVYEIDWRQEHKRLADRMPRGGVVRIHHAGDISAWRRFDAVVKKRFAERRGRSTSIRIDSDWHTTRFLVDILAEFDRKLTEAGLEAPTATRSAPRKLDIMSGNQIDGNADMHIGVINMNGPSHRQQLRERDAAVEEVCRRIARLLDRGDRFLVAMHSSPAREQTAFWRDFWNRGLSELTSKGMLLIHYVEEREMVHGDAPDPDEEIWLPRDFSDDARDAEAYDDLIDMFVKLGMRKEEAAAMAVGHLNSNKKSVDEFYNNLTSLVMRIGRLKS